MLNLSLQANKLNSYLKDEVTPALKAVITYTIEVNAPRKEKLPQRNNWSTSVNNTESRMITLFWGNIFQNIDLYHVPIPKVVCLFRSKK